MRCARSAAHLAACALVAALSLLLVGPARSDLVWWDGSREPASGPPGKLLTDNAGYWGDAVLTGVDYAYEQAPDNPPDVYRDDAARFGRRLLDGRPSGNWWVPVGRAGGPIAAVFDFKRRCTFAEVGICTRSRRVALQIAVRNAPHEPWRAVYDRPLAQSPDTAFHRVRLPARPEGRYLRVRVEAEGITYLEEVIAWGDAEVSEATPEAYRPTAPAPVASEIAFQSVPGIAKTAFSDAAFWDWQRRIGAWRRQPVVWSRAPAWDSITHQPLLPQPQSLARTVELSVARNATAHAALVLTNTTCLEARACALSVGAFRRSPGGQRASGLVAELRVAGALPSRHYGVNMGPLFGAGNLLPSGLLRRYLTNGAGIQDWPRLRLSPAGSAVLWLSVTASGTKPGVYETDIACEPGPNLRVRVEVLDVTLPRPRVWLQTWSEVTGMFPFQYGDRARREVDAKRSLGVTVWNGWPEPGTPSGIARSLGPTFHDIWGIDDYGHRLYNAAIDPDKLTKDDEKRIAAMVRGHVRKARALGLSYDDWYVQLTDEPGPRNARAFGALARLIRNADPRVRIYCNPSFWNGTGVDSDAIVSDALGPWYRELVDISVPIYLLLQDRPKSFALFDAPRAVRAFYTVSTQSAKSERAEQVELYTRLAWDAFRRGWNGWGFYSYYAPRGDPWNDMDADWMTGEDLPDYLMVYPGPRGPIPTRQSEAVRQGWQDYCLLTLLQRQGRKAELRAILRGYERGEPLEALRLRALRAAAGRPSRRGEGSGDRGRAGETSPGPRAGGNRALHAQRSGSIRKTATRSTLSGTAPWFHTRASIRLGSPVQSASTTCQRHSPGAPSSPARSARVPRTPAVAA